MFKNWRVKLGNWLLKKQEKIDLGLKTLPEDELDKDVIADAYLAIANDLNIKDLFNYMIAGYDKQILSLSDFTFNPMTTPNDFQHYLTRKFVEIGKLKARKNLLTYLMKHSKVYVDKAKIDNWRDKR